MVRFTDHDLRPVAAAVTVHGGRVLLVRRQVPEGRLSWQFPAGGAVMGETIPDAAVREALEETGVTVTAGRVIGDRIHPLTGRWVFYVACRLVAGTAHVAAPAEVAEVAWSTLPQIRGLIPDGVYGPVEQHLLTATGVTG